MHIPLLRLLQIIPDLRNLTQIIQRRDARSVAFPRVRFVVVIIGDGGVGGVGADVFAGFEGAQAPGIGGVEEGGGVGRWVVGGCGGALGEEGGGEVVHEDGEVAGCWGGEAGGLEVEGGGEVVLGVGGVVGC